MEYAWRVRDALIEMNPGEVGIWRLPPMTPGSIIIKTYYSMPAGWNGGGGGSPRTTRTNPVGAGRATVRDPGIGGGGGGTIAMDARPWRPGMGGDLEVDPGDLGSFGETMELTLELLRAGSPVAVGLNHILHGTPNSGDIWALRITRKNDGSLDRRRYRVNLQYPSVLPLEVRRVPIGFLTRGFDANWNDNPYLEWMQIRDNVLSYQWNRDFAALHHRPMDNVHVPLGDKVIFPTIKSIGLRLQAGGGPDPIAPSIPNQVVRDMPFFALRIDCTYEGSRNVELEIPGLNPSYPLPDPLWIIARFYLAPSNGGTLTYYTEVESPLLEAIDRNVSYPTLSGEMETINLKQLVKGKLEDYLYGLQFGENGKRLDSLKRWLVGRYELVGTGYDRNREEMVFTYVGRQQPPAPSRLSVHNIATHMSLGTAPAQPEPTWPRLYDTPYEMPLPAPEGGFGGVLPTPHDAGALNKIDHIVVLMQENRSFDQVLGYLSRDGMVPRSALLSRNPNATREAAMSPADVDGLLRDEPNAPNTRDTIRYPDQLGAPVYKCMRSFTSGWPMFLLDNPCHGHDCTERQISDNMKGFIADYARKPGMGPTQYQLIMNYMTDIELPTFGALTREFAICDKWFCSHIGGTLPNRFINLTGDLSEDVYGSPEVENPDLFGSFAPLEATTFLDHLSARNVSWRLFEHNYSTLRMFRKYTFDDRNTVGFNDPLRGFEKMARDGTLPAVSFIEPDYIEAPGGNDDHAPADMINGQILIARIMAALLDSPQWSKTLFIITYDEHGGFYDHVPLPFEVTTTAPDGTVTTRNNAPLSNGERRFGVRVPTFVISPLIPGMPGGKVNVSHTVFDHTSITATILRRFCGMRIPDMGPRVAAAEDLRHLLTLDAARPRTEFDALAAEMRAIAQWQTVALAGVPPKPLRLPDAQLEDFHALVAYATCLTGKGR